MALIKLGSDVSLLDSNTIKIASTGTDLIIVGVNSSNSKVQVYKWSGSAWVQVGIDIDNSLGTSAYLSLTVYGNDIVVVVADVNGRNYKILQSISGGNFSEVAYTGFPHDTSDAVRAIQYSPAGSLYALAVDFSVSQRLYLFTYSGGTWSGVGTYNGTSTTSYKGFDISFVGAIPYITRLDSGNDDWRVYKYDSGWVQIGGNIFSGAGILFNNYPKSLVCKAADNIYCLVTRNSGYGVFYYNGVSWSQLGATFATTTASLSIAVDSSNNVYLYAYHSATGKVRIYKWGGSSWDTDYAEVLQSPASGNPSFGCLHGTVNTIVYFKGAGVAEVNSESTSALITGTFDFSLPVMQAEFTGNKKVDGLLDITLPQITALFIPDVEDMPPGTPWLTQIENNVKSIIEAIRMVDGFHFDWEIANQEDLAKCTFPAAMIYLEPDEENLDDRTGAHSGTYLNKVTFRIHVVGKIEIETSNPNFEANAVLTKALDDLKKVFGINYHINDTADSFMYRRATRIRKQNGDIFIPAELDTIWDCTYFQIRIAPDKRTCT